jgi:hypothetical protein
MSLGGTSKEDLLKALSDNRGRQLVLKAGGVRLWVQGRVKYEWECERNFDL